MCRDFHHNEKTIVRSFYLNNGNVCTMIFCQLFHIYPGKAAGFILFSWLLCHLWYVRIIGYITACLFAHYTISLSSLCRLIWMHWTYKMLARYVVECVPQLSCMQHVGLCVFSLPINLVMIVRLCLLLILCIYNMIRVLSNHDHDHDDHHQSSSSSSNQKYEPLAIVYG